MARSVVVCWGTGDYPYSPADARGESGAQLGGCWAKDLLVAKRLNQDQRRDSFTFDPSLASKRIYNGVDTKEVARIANDIQRFLREKTRLGIPAIFHEESCSGYQCRDATLFPVPLALAATFEPELVFSMTQHIAPLMRGTGCHQALAPVLDVTRDPRWGRVEETFGEDPYLVSRMGCAYIKGLQQGGVVATAKHFVGYGHSEGGKNWAPVQVGERELREVFVEPFRAAVKEAKVASVMNAYHEIDGVPCGASGELLRDLLQDDLGFDGVVVSDISVDAENRRIEEAAKIAQSADVAILFLGSESGLTKGCSTGESNDSTSITLPGKQRDLVLRVASTGVPVVLILISGRPLGLDVESKLLGVKSIIQAWVPGQMGGDAIADILLGKSSPGGKLPISLPYSVGQIPVFYNHKPSGGRSHWRGIYTDLDTCEPLYPFGFGLSYTSFEIKDFSLRLKGQPSTTPKGMLKVLVSDTVRVSVVVRNVGERSGDEVVQLYVGVVGASVTRPVKEMKGFKRTPLLSPGESLRVTFHLPVAMAGYYGRDMRFGLEGGTKLSVMIGTSSASILHTQQIEVEGSKKGLVEIQRVFECPFEVCKDDTKAAL